MDRVSVLTVKNKIILFFSKVRIAKGAILLGKIRIYNYGKIFIGNSFSLVGLSFLIHCVGIQLLFLEQRRMQYWK